MTVSTTISSTSVKPYFFFISPLPVRQLVQAYSIAPRIDVVNILARLGVRSGAGKAAQAPFPAGERILRHAPQEKDPGFLRAGLVLHALDQRREVRRIAGGVGLALHLAVVGGALVGVDRLADLAQRGAQLALLAALPGELGERRRDRGEQRHDRDHDQQLDEREALHGREAFTRLLRLRRRARRRRPLTFRELAGRRRGAAGGRRRLHR